MADTEVQVEVQLTADSPPGHPVLQEDAGGERESLSPDSPPNTGHGEVEEPLALLAGVALAPWCGDVEVACSCDCEDRSCLEVRLMERNLQSMQQQFQLLMSEVDDLNNCLVNGLGHQDRGALAAAVPSFLHTCQCYFNQLESARRTIPQHTPLPFDIYPKRVQLLDLSQQLCDSLEQLVLTYASYNLLCLDETEPNSISHFCIGRSQLGRLRLTTFRYCKPTPYLAQVNTGLYKRMRWNVERLQDEQQTDEEQCGDNEERDGKAVGDTEYYFLCYEEIPNICADANRNCQSNIVRTWSIGQWVQVKPDPDTQDIYDWITCEVPQANYHRVLFLGSDEPSCCRATEFLQQLLMSWQTTE